MTLDVDAVSGISGSISIACWIVVFTPQIWKNFQRGSADGLSIAFLVVWLVGDVFNILGAVLQGVLPTMIILAVYYTLADIALLAQCLYYRRASQSGAPASLEARPKRMEEEEGGDEEEEGEEEETEGKEDDDDDEVPARRSTAQSPLLPKSASSTSSAAALAPSSSHPPPLPMHAPDPTPKRSKTNARRASPLLLLLLQHSLALLAVCLAGAIGWSLSQVLQGRGRRRQRQRAAPAAAFSLPGQVFGYLCALLYLGSRVPQLVLNHRRRSTAGLSLLFFLFACAGNAMFVLSILAASSADGGGGGGVGGDGGGDGGHDGSTEVYRRYLLLNLSWLVRSVGTLVLDLAVFGQFFCYRRRGRGRGRRRPAGAAA
ncbi:MAG: hypothetical protein M1826_006904 [Phylliscum demangeonii]|nr:MAG: hypothetical protein M1826_006904 [Phylliscum demangeonii]